MTAALLTVQPFLSSSADEDSMSGSGSGPSLGSDSGSITLRAIGHPARASKIATATSTSTAKQLLNPQRCRVPLCPNRNCQLTSHLLYDLSSGKTTLDSDALHAKRGKPKVADSGIDKIERDGVDQFPLLPIEDSLEPNRRALFHHFFDTVFDKLADLFRGPRQMPNYKNHMLTVALTNQTYCMGLITQAQTDIAISRGSFEETIFSLGLYTQLIKIFRTQLAANSGKGPSEPAHIEIALLILCILLSYSATYGRFNELSMNWNAMRRLIASRGGIHNLTFALAYVIHVDRLCSTMLGTPPTYVSPKPRLQQFCRPAWLRYGSGFTRIQRGPEPVISAQVLEYALDTCELLSLHEAMHSLPVRVQRPALRPTASQEYLYYRRDRVDELFAIIHAQMLDENTVSKCALLAARIVEYPVTWSNYVPTLTKHMCTQLCNLLRAQDLFEVWFGLLDVLRWVLFALVTTPWPFDGRSWALNCLQGIISAKFGADEWSDHWWEEELTNLEEFVWSDGYYAPKLGQVWKELEAGTREKPSKNRKKQITNN